MKIAIRVILIFLALYQAESFYIYLTNSTSQCFYHYIFKNEQLLVEIETPTVSSPHRIVLTVKNNNETVLEKDIYNLVKIVVPRATNEITEQGADLQHQYETCLRVDKFIGQISQQQDSNIPPPQGYFLSVKLMSNFSHLLEDNIDKAKEKGNIDYLKIGNISQRLFQLNSEQITLHQINEAKQKLTQTYLQTLKEKIILYSMIEIVMILAFTTLQVKVLQVYLNDLSVV